MNILERLIMLFSVDIMGTIEADAWVSIYRIGGKKIEAFPSTKDKIISMINQYGNQYTFDIDWYEYETVDPSGYLINQL